MKKLVQINVVCNGSTGRIMCDIAKKALEEGLESYCFYGRGNPNNEVNCIKIDNKIEVYFHVLLTRLFNLHGHGSYFATKRLVKRLKKINPDIIHLHNIHGYYINLKVLFKYLKKDYKGKIIWTLHDCWTFTGHCAYFTIAKCNKWKKECFSCPQKKSYPSSYLFDTSNHQYFLKKKIFTGLNNLTIVTPSNWLADLVKMSFLKEYKIVVINNGIDLDIFKPTYDDNIYNKYNIPKDKKIILGVANIWEERKGIKDFIKLSKVLDENNVIVLVGKIENLKLPEKIIHIDRTDNAKELAKIYSISHVFFNPTYEDNYPTTNLEAIACGTTVITYDTGGCKEVEKFGNVIITNSQKMLSVLNIQKHIVCKAKLKDTEIILSKDTNYAKYIKLYL